jgi:hypothetical protein
VPPSCLEPRPLWFRSMVYGVSFFWAW